MTGKRGHQRGQGDQRLRAMKVVALRKCYVDADLPGDITVHRQSAEARPETASPPGQPV